MTHAMEARMTDYSRLNDADLSDQVAVRVMGWRAQPGAMRSGAEGAGCEGRHVSALRYLALLLFALSASALADLRQCQVYSETEAKGPRIVLMNESPDDKGAGKSGPRAGKWMAYDLTAITPPGTELVSVRLEGRMIISRGHYDGLCQIIVNVVPGSAIPHDPDPPWIGQATAGSTVGARVPWSVTVPVRYVEKHPRFLLRWRKTGQGATAPYPRGCNFGLNLWLVSACAIPTSP